MLHQNVWMEYPVRLKLLGKIYLSSLLTIMCNILTFDPAVNQETGASGRRYQDITLTVDRLNSVQLRRHRKQVYFKQLYNLVPQTAWVSWSQFVEFELQIEAVRTSSRRRAWALMTPVEQLNRIRKKCCFDQRNLGSICCRLFCLQLISHTQPFRNPFVTLSRIKCERYIFLKNYVRSFIIVAYVSTCICIRIVVSPIYNIFNFQYWVNVCFKEKSEENILFFGMFI